MLLWVALSWRRFLSCRNQSTDLLCKSMAWFLYDRDLRHERFRIFWTPFSKNTPKWLFLKVRMVILKISFDTFTVRFFFINILNKYDHENLQNYLSTVVLSFLIRTKKDDNRILIKIVLCPNMGRMGQTCAKKVSFAFLKNFDFSFSLK